MNIRIWAMQFIGMLAFALPIQLGYDLQNTARSLPIAIALSAFALWMVCQQTLPWPKLISGALIMGASVAGMHYTGMTAMRMLLGIHYDPLLFTCSGKQLSQLMPSIDIGAFPENGWPVGK